MAAIAFHVAPQAARAAICARGLVAAGPRPRTERYGLHQQPAGVYLWRTVERAKRWAEDFHRLYGGAPAGLCDVYAVDVGELVVEDDPDEALAEQGSVFTPVDVTP